MTEVSKSRKSQQGSVLGIDIGSVALSIVQMDLSGEIQNTVYLFHKGKIRESLLSATEGIDIAAIRGIACCASPCFNQDFVHSYNSQLAIIAATKKLSPTARSVLMVGAEKFMLINFDQQGVYASTETNSSCAAGTGSFLDQQAFRLNLPDIEELCNTAQRNNGKIPDIASRCSVFAKTDLIHAQQQGYPLEAICDSLCKGLAKNIMDTLFTKEIPNQPVLFTGGVSKNKAVVKHLENQLNTRFLLHEHAHLFGAIGACFLLLEQEDLSHGKGIKLFDEILLTGENTREYYFEPLSLSLSEYPDFRNDGSWNFIPLKSSHTAPVEVDLYDSCNGNRPTPVFLGIDIGSSSTKAIITNEEAQPLAGFYTQTSGQPVQAIQALFEAIHDFGVRKNISFSIQGAGSTGSGRKFIGKIIRADMIIDEITAHARAAYELNPSTDTIIEIGGQDSKFTTMHKGSVTFSQMNTVCAAGTGSFLEEQAKKLACPLSEYAARAEGARAPLASDRCTVFMERDINQLLNAGYSVSEILATAIHSVMENYLRKVAAGGSIGENICFQGATAKNKALVAAFEQKLQKKIFVSRFCHLTGALGVALLLKEEKENTTSFRGLDLYQETIPVTTETCRHCINHCLITLATLQGEKEAYGFHCGRDYDTERYVAKKDVRVSIPEKHRQIFNLPEEPHVKHTSTIGIPAALHLFEELSLWKRFFYNLSIRVITSEHYSKPVQTGKRIAGAEFCSPINATYGHVAYLVDKADYIFFPISLEANGKPDQMERYYCYYTIYAGSLVKTMKEKNIDEMCISPLLYFFKGETYVVKQLIESLGPIFGSAINQFSVRQAFNESLQFYKNRKKEVVRLFDAEFRPESELSIALLGRPYIVNSKAMNKGIPDIFTGMDIKTFFQDMIPVEDQVPEEVERMLKKIPWHYAAKILEAANTIATTKNLYPVLITAFKCAPDSFVIEYFKKLMNHYQKPYLILQIDDHDSNVGYETRVEAAIRSFKNHAAAEKELQKGRLEILPQLETKINGKTLLFPSWDPLVAPLLVANLNRAGIDTRLLQSSEQIMKKSMVHNTGQCLPINIIAQEFIDYIETNGLRPEDTMLWMLKGYIPCNLRFFPYYIKSLLEDYGKGIEKASVYFGELSHLEISYGAGYYAYFAYLLGGLIRKVGCRIRPYEINKGETNDAITQSVRILEEAFSGSRNIEHAVLEIVSGFEQIEKVEDNRPGVAIFGDLYIRDNDIMNQNLIQTIEKAGGEVITTPYTDLVKINIENTLRRAGARGDYYMSGIYRVMLAALKVMEEKYYQHFRPFLGDKPVINPKQLEKHLEKFNINLYHSGESYENILKIFYIIENYPDISLFVQTNPAFCCPSLVTEAMTHEIKRITGIPVVTLTYDGTIGKKNDVIEPYLAHL
ncbi:MAG: CoA activase [Bacteroidales bacterium]|nr:CoA activase [Bacteroidota bacterium]MBL6949205.1 CoA activase [Bacteroidales bacterium]